MKSSLGFGAALERAVRRQYFDGERVDAPSQFGSKCLHDGAVLGEPWLTFEPVRGDTDTEVCFSAFPPAGVPPVPLTLVEDFKMSRREFRGKFRNNRLAN